MTVAANVATVITITVSSGYSSTRLSVLLLQCCCCIRITACTTRLQIVLVVLCCSTTTATAEPVLAMHDVYSTNNAALQFAVEHENLQHC
jgi:hypothetical protein